MDWLGLLLLLVVVVVVVAVIGDALGGDGGNPLAAAPTPTRVTRFLFLIGFLLVASKVTAPPKTTPLPAGIEGLAVTK
jgi:hypothetical protein